jgi:hypothetical protein
MEIRGAGEGVLSTLSVYERLKPFRLEFVALDQQVHANSTTLFLMTLIVLNVRTLPTLLTVSTLPYLPLLPALPTPLTLIAVLTLLILLTLQENSNKESVHIEFVHLRERFSDQPELLKPENTDEMVHSLLPDFYFESTPANLLQLCYKGAQGDEAKKVVDLLEGGAAAEDGVAPENARVRGTVLMKSGVKVGGIKLLYQVTGVAGDKEGGADAWIFSLYHRPTSSTYEHAVDVADFPKLKRQLKSRCNLNFGAFIKRKTKWAQELVGLLSTEGVEPPVLKFSGQALCAYDALAPKKGGKKSAENKAQKMIAPPAVVAAEVTPEAPVASEKATAVDDDYEEKYEDDAEAFQSEEAPAEEAAPAEAEPEALPEAAATEPVAEVVELVAEVAEPEPEVAEAEPAEENYEDDAAAEPVAEVAEPEPVAEVAEPEPAPAEAEVAIDAEAVQSEEAPAEENYEDDEAAEPVAEVAEPEPEVAAEVVTTMDAEAVQSKEAPAEEAAPVEAEEAVPAEAEDAATEAAATSNYDEPPPAEEEPEAEADKVTEKPARSADAADSYGEDEFA